MSLLREEFVETTVIEFLRDRAIPIEIDSSSLRFRSLWALCFIPFHKLARKGVRRPSANALLVFFTCGGCPSAPGKQAEEKN